MRILLRFMRTGENTVALADCERHASTNFPIHPRALLLRGWLFPALAAGVFFSGDGMTGIAFSRSAKDAGLATFGKNTERMETTIPEDAKDALDRKAKMVGMDLSAFHRTVLLSVAFGPDEMKARATAHLDATLGIAGLLRGNSGDEPGKVD